MTNGSIWQERRKRKEREAARKLLRPILPRIKQKEKEISEFREQIQLTRDQQGHFFYEITYMQQLVQKADELVEAKNRIPRWKLLIEKQKAFHDAWQELNQIPNRSNSIPAWQICFYCFRRFDEGANLPKCLPCGHTLCKRCIQQEIDRNGRFLCLHDGKTITSKDLKKLRTNYAVKAD